MTDNEIVCAMLAYSEINILSVNGELISIGDILELVNRKNEEIERLDSENKAFGEIIKKQDDEISVLRKHLLKREDLEKSFSKTVKQFDKKIERTVKLERAEAVREFAKSLIDKAENGVISIVDLPEYVKESTGEG